MHLARQKPKIAPVGVDRGGPPR